MFHRARVSGYSPIQTPTNEGPPVDSRDFKFVLTTDRYVVQKKVIHTVVAVNLVSKN